MTEEHSVAKTYNDVIKLFNEKNVDYDLCEIETKAYSQEYSNKRIGVYTDGSGDESYGVFIFDKKLNLCKFEFSLCSWECDVDAIAYYDYPPCFIFQNEEVTIGKLYPNFIESED